MSWVRNTLVVLALVVLFFRILGLLNYLLMNSDNLYSYIYIYNKLYSRKEYHHNPNLT